MAVTSPINHSTAGCCPRACSSSAPSSSRGTCLVPCWPNERPYRTVRTSCSGFSFRDRGRLAIFALFISVISSSPRLGWINVTCCALIRFSLWTGFPPAISLSLCGTSRLLILWPDCTFQNNISIFPCWKWTGMRACLAGSGVGVSPLIFLWCLLDVGVLRTCLSFIVWDGRFAWRDHWVVPASAFMIY